MSEKKPEKNVGTGEAQGGGAPTVARLCYVDDSRTSAYVVRHLLEPLGYHIDHFASAEPAFVALIQDNYDLLLTDLKVSSTGMDGDDLVRTLRQSGHPKISTLPIIVITGSTDAEVLVGVYDAGANQVMSKPVVARELDGHIRRLLFDGRRTAQEAANPAPSPNAPLPAEPLIPVLDVTDAPPGQPLQDSAIPILTPEHAGAFSPSPQAGVALPDAAPEHITGPEPDALSWEEAVEAIIIEPDDSGWPGAQYSPGSDETASRRHRFPPRAGRDDEDDDILSDHDYTLVSTQRRRFLKGRGARGWLIWVVLPGLVIVAGLVAWGQYTGRGQPVETTLVTRGEIHQSIRVSGRVVSQQTITVSPAVIGRLVDVAVNEGDVVSVGQVLARLDGSEPLSRLGRARAELANARENLTQAQRTLDRLRKAHRAGAVAKRFVGDANADLRTARSKVGVAVEKVHSASQALEKQSITATISGVIVARNADVDQWVSPTDGLFSLADPTRLVIEARIDAAADSGITAGQMVNVSDDADPGQPWQETVTGLSTPDRQGSDDVTVRISLGSDAPTLRIGQPVNVDIRTAWNPVALKIPFDALISRDGQTLVAVLAEGRVQLRVVETGIEGLTMAEVKQGLKPGERIILANGRQLMAGDKVYAAQVSN